MKPKVILNKIPFSDDFIESVNSSLINSEGLEAQKDYISRDIQETLDGENPWVIIVCTPNGLLIDKNF